MAPPPLRYAVQGFAPLRRLESKWTGGKELQEGIGKSAGAWHVTLGERSGLGRKIFPPKEATENESRH
jgi:hypothetical protein